MIEFRSDDNVFYIKVLGKIEEGDFENNIREAAEDAIVEYGKIRGILVDASDFEGWEDFPALLEHIGFIRELDDSVYRVAIIGDQTWQKLIPPIAGLFLEPLIKRFDPGHAADAEDWVKCW